MTHHVTGIFTDHAIAVEALEKLLEAGYKRSDIILAESPAELRREIDLIYDENDHKAMWWGGMRGGFVGAIGLGLATLVFFWNSSPEIFGPIMVVGVLVGFTAGSFLGGLSGLGTGEKEASKFVHKIKPEHSVLSVRPSMDRPLAKTAEMLNRYGAIDTLMH